jgi:hypothetical protein
MVMPLNMSRESASRQLQLEGLSPGRDELNTHARNLSPQYSFVLPTHGEQHSESSTFAASLASLFPQKQPYAASTPAIANPDAKQSDAHSSLVMFGQFTVIT